MKRIGIITLTRRLTLAYAVLKKIVEKLNYSPVCGEAIGSSGVFFPLEELSAVGHDFLTGFFKKAQFENLDVILISVPYSVNLFHLPKLIRCLRCLNTAPIVLGGNEVSNNYENIMWHRYAAFENELVDIAPDFIVRGAAENALNTLLPLLDKTTQTKKWNRAFITAFLQIPNLVFWMPDRRALFSTPFSSDPLQERDIFACVKYGEKSIAITLQRACIWTKKSGGGCLFCSIASQFGKDFHCAVENDFFIQELAEMLQKDPSIQYVDIWDDTFNIDEKWVLKICSYLRTLSGLIGRKCVFSCFLRPKGLSEALTGKMGEADFRVAFLGADALTEELSRRMRRGCSVSELNASIDALGRSGIMPRLSVQLFTPESTIDDVGITATVVLGCIRNDESSAHVHLYTFPLFGSDIYRLLEARENLKTIPSPLLRRSGCGGFDSYPIAFDFIGYDPDVEEIKKKTFAMLGLSASFCVKTYPGDHVDGRRLQAVVSEVRTLGIEAKKRHFFKSMWYMLVLLREDMGSGVIEEDWFGFLCRNEPVDAIPKSLRNVYGNFGYRFTLSRSRDEVIGILVSKKEVCRTDRGNYRLTTIGLKALRTMLDTIDEPYVRVAAYGVLSTYKVLNILESRLSAINPEKPI